ncbi:MAG TPA: imidazole glycerol phosphate synthase subunit HisH [Firmicutes bacterium]|nr:imidazole glycerol phosphate synthase subunit HisH [Bacillota bacterium]
MIAVLDYGIGNLMSVRKALMKLGCPPDVTRDPRSISRADALILPGVGAFGEAMDFLEGSGLIETVTEFIHSGRPVLGICLGMQILFEKSEESPWATGLSAIRGVVKRFDFTTESPHVAGRAPKVPHMGWNRVKIKKKNELLESIPDGSYFYFAHSFYAVPENPEVEVGETFYGYGTIPSVVAEGLTFGVQFHPEKSGDVGLALLNNFIRMCG